MTDGSSQGLFVIVAVVIFGIFVAISYALFQNQLKTGLSTIFGDSIEQSRNVLNSNTGNNNVENKEILNVKIDIDGYSGLASDNYSTPVKTYANIVGDNKQMNNGKINLDFHSSLPNNIELDDLFIGDVDTYFFINATYGDKIITDLNKDVFKISINNHIMTSGSVDMDGNGRHYTTFSEKELRTALKDVNGSIISSSNNYLVEKPVTIDFEYEGVKTSFTLKIQYQLP